MSILSREKPGSNGKLVKRRLTAAHLADLRASGLSDDQIAACGFRTVTDTDEIRDLLNWGNSAGSLGDCLVIPFAGADGKRTDYCRLKPDCPRELDGKTAKYESPKGELNRAYIPPGTVPALRDPSAPLLMTEGEKKSAKADQEGFPCIGLVGVWGWQKKRPTGDDGKCIGPRELIPDLAGVVWKGRQVCIVFDSDAADKPDVQRAERELANALAKLVALVKIVRLPAGDDGEKTGLDDFLLARGPEALRKLLGEAEPADLLELQQERIGSNGKCKLSALWAGEVAHTDQINPVIARHRERFAQELIRKSPAAKSVDVAAKLLALANSDGKRADVEADEIDVSFVVRPEQFFTSDVCGLAVPVACLVEGKPSATYRLFLRWSDGRRECRPLGNCVDLRGGAKLWLHPTPGAPAVAVSDWSAEARAAWLEGAPAPNATDLLRRLRERILRFVELPEATAQATATTLALWVLLTYVFRTWPAVPYLHVGGTMGSGKSRVFEILARLVFRPLASSSMTGPALFRTQHDRGGALLLDEAERLRQVNDPAQQEICAMLLAGYKRGGQAVRLEPVGDYGFRAVSFDVYGPKALACIAGLPPVLASRCIPILMFRAGADSKKPKRRIDAAPGKWQALRDDLHALALEHGQTWIELAKRNDVLPTQINGRDAELWQPLLALAAWIEDQGERGLLKSMQVHALVTIDAARDDAIPDADETLLEILAEQIEAGQRPEPGDLLREAREKEPITFERWTARTVSHRLKSYALETRRSNGKRRFACNTDDLLRIQRAYGIDLQIFDPTLSRISAPVDPEKSADAGAQNRKTGAQTAESGAQRSKTGAQRFEPTGAQQGRKRLTQGRKTQDRGAADGDDQSDGRGARGAKGRKSRVGVSKNNRAERNGQAEPEWREILI